MNFKARSYQQSNKSTPAFHQAGVLIWRRRRGSTSPAGDSPGPAGPPSLKTPARGRFSGAAGPFAALRLHWSLIHCRSVRIPHAKKAPMKGTFVFGGGGGIRLRLRSPVAALRLHWSLIHCRSVRIPHTKSPHEGDFCFWRRRWDSNPRGLAPYLISSQGRYDHFDTPPRRGLSYRKQGDLSRRGGEGDGLCVDRKCGREKTK